MFRSIAVSLTFLCTLGTAAAEAAAPSWVSTGPIGTARYEAAGAQIAGGALMIGGRPDGGDGIVSVERFDAATGGWSPTGDLAEARYSASAVTLPDGRVLVAGGGPVPLSYHDSTEVYDPATGSWSAGPTMKVERSAFALETLTDGTVLALGGWSPVTQTTGAEVIDVATDTTTLTEPMHEVRAAPAATRLADGRVFAAGGWTSGTRQLTSAEVYDPESNEWTEVAPMREPRMYAKAATLPDGRVLVVGGTRNQGAPTFLTQTSDTYEIYDPATDAWTAPKRLNRPRGEGSEFVVLADGRPVVVGGYTQATYGYENTAEIYDPVRDAWTLTPAMAVGRAEHVAIRLADGSVLVTAGFGAGRTSQRLVVEPLSVVEPPPETQSPPPAATPTPAPAAAPTPKPGVAAVTVPKRLKVSKTGALALRVRCVGETACRQRLSLRMRGGRTLARTNVAVQPGRAKTVKLKLTRKDRKRLAGRTVKVTVVLGTLKRNTTLKL